MKRLAKKGECQNGYIALARAVEQFILGLNEDAPRAELDVLNKNLCDSVRNAFIELNLLPVPRKEKNPSKMRVSPKTKRRDGFNPEITPGPWVTTEPFGYRLAFISDHNPTIELRNGDKQAILAVPEYKALTAAVREFKNNQNTGNMLKILNALYALDQHGSEIIPEKSPEEA